MSEEISGEEIWNAIYEIGKGIMLDCHLEPENLQDDPRRRLSGRIYAVVRNKGIPISIPPDVLKVFEPPVPVIASIQEGKGIVSAVTAIPKVVFDTTIGGVLGGAKKLLNKIYHSVPVVAPEEKPKEEG